MNRFSFVSVRRRLVAQVVLAVLLAWIPTHGAARGDGRRAIITAVALQFIPGGRDQPPLPLVRGGRLEFVNADPLGWHQIVSTDYDASGEPVFSSALVGFGQWGPVRGVESLPPGRYAFICATHWEGMSGALEVSG